MMSGSGPTKIYIKVDSAADTQVSYKFNKKQKQFFWGYVQCFICFFLLFKENMKNSRKTFKVLQKTADKENLVGRNITSMKENLLKR